MFTDADFDFRLTTGTHVWLRDGTRPTRALLQIFNEWLQTQSRLASPSIIPGRLLFDVYHDRFVNAVLTDATLAMRVELAASHIYLGAPAAVAAGGNVFAAMRYMTDVTV